VAEQAVLDLVPLRGARRIVMDVEGQSSFVGEFLQRTFQSRTCAPLEPPQSAVIVNSRMSG
jgi:hypothetical protein